MGKIGDGYGSKYHLLQYRREKAPILDGAVQKIIGGPGTELNWIYPSDEASTTKAHELEGLEFLRSEKDVMRAWKEFWPQTGRQQTWDGIAYTTRDTEKEWLLFEAKANHPEFCSPPSRSISNGRRMIEKAMGKMKNYLGVHRDFPWLGTFYQYANRLASLYFLNVVAEVPSRLVLIYFYGDRFPDDRPCPRDEAEWRELIRACHLTLGLPEHHKLSDRMHEVFLPALVKQSREKSTASIGELSP